MNIFRNKAAGILSLFFMATAVAASAAPARLVFEDVEVPTGKNIQIPLILENSEDIVAVQFDITLPSVMTFVEDVTPTNRWTDHTYHMNMRNGQTYRVMVFSPSNSSFAGNAGSIMMLNAYVYDHAEEGVAYPVTLSNVVLADKDGNNRGETEARGTIFIEAMPDLVPSALTATEANLTPGQTVGVSWQVANNSVKPTGAGWKEQIFLETPDGSVTKLIATTYCTDILAGNGVAMRSAEVAIPAILGLDGEAYLRLKVTPDPECGEPTSLRENNDIRSEKTYMVAKQLYLDAPRMEIDEKGGMTEFAVDITRSGNVEKAETFKISFTPVDNRLDAPASVTIPAWSSAERFYIHLTPNGVLDDIDQVSLVASADGYLSKGLIFNIIDDTDPSLTLTASADEVTEGESLTLTITAQRAVSEDLPVTLICDYPSRFRFPEVVVIPAGNRSAEVMVETVDDDKPDATRTVTFTAAAIQHVSGQVEIDLIDDDLPILSLTLSPNAVSEDAGPLAVAAVVKRLDNINKKVTIKFSDDSDGDIFYGTPTLVLNPGEEEATVYLGPVDNDKVDGTREITVTAAVYLSSCSCTVGAGHDAGTVTANLTVYDNDGPSLSMSVANSTIAEGGSTTVTVGRNTSTAQALSVKIESDCDGLEFPATVTIPAGQASTTFTLKSIPDDSTQNSFTAVLTASADGYSSATGWLMVSDQTLPDAYIKEISLDRQEVLAGEEVTVSVTLGNQGVYELPELTPVEIYLNGSTQPAATMRTPAAIAPNGETTMKKTIAMPREVRENSIYATVNPKQNIIEINYRNNTSEVKTVKTLAPYTLTVKADKAVYRQGEAVVFTGQATGNLEDASEVEIYVMNQGARTALQAPVDASGSFKAEYLPLKGLIGAFSYGACYPGEGKKETVGSFEVPGIKRASGDYLKCEATVGQPFEKKFTIENPGSIAVTGLTATTVSAADGIDVVLSVPSQIGAGESAEVTATINTDRASGGSSWEEIKINVGNADGVSLPVTLYYFATTLKGQLKADMTAMQTTMQRGKTRQYPVTITNTGRGETGRISVATPSWMKTSTPKEMASLESGESATVVFELTPTDEMQLNVPVTGQVAFNCANGQGMVLPFNIETVSDELGTLSLLICDEYTYYTADAPKVAGAKVTVSHPTNGTKVAEGVTDASGRFSIEVPEGYYAVSVTADRHDSYRNNLLVDPGRERVVTVNLSVQSIDVSWDVVETEVEDEYEIVTTVKFETSVPQPVVNVILPNSVDGEALADGESIIFTATLVNEGLITANDLTFRIPESEGDLYFEILGNEAPYKLAPKQSITLPIRMTRHIGSGYGVRRAPGVRCWTDTDTEYSWECGEDNKWHLYSRPIKVRRCIAEPGSSSGGGGGGGGGGVGGPGGIGGSGGPYYSDDNITEVAENEYCIPCLDNIGYRLGTCVAGFIPVFGCPVGVVDCASGLYNAWKYNDWNWRQPLGCILTAVGCACDVAAIVTTGGAGVPLCDMIGQIPNIIGCLIPWTEPCYPQGDIVQKPGKRQAASSPEEPAYVTEFREEARIALDVMEGLRDYFDEIFGSTEWLDNCSLSELGTLVEAVLETPEGHVFTTSELLRYKPEQISTAQLETFVQRLNNTQLSTEGKLSGTDNYIHGTILIDAIDRITDADNKSKEMGFVNTNEMWAAAKANIEARLAEDRDAVCASITLQFTQKMVMTRQAFRGTLSVHNGHDTQPMTNVVLSLNITDQDGIQSTSHLFQTNLESLEGFTGAEQLGSPWQLEAKGDGKATVLFIPTKYAAPEADKPYNFGGAISYIDPFTATEVTRVLSPVTLTVKPSPVLDLTYFMQRDVMGDDPLTSVVEPMEEAEFSLLINNVGLGDATNVRMTTDQPKIVDNQKGLMIEFEIISSLLNGKERSMALGGSVQTDFGTIPAGSQAYAQWFFTSTLMGHFTDYKVEATHLTSYGNEDLSLLGNVSIHELIRSLEIPFAGTNLVGFLCNDVPDPNDTPDRLYLSNGQIELVGNAANAEMTRINDSDYRLTVTPAAGGWNYGNIADATYGQQLLSVRREDGTELSLRNFWLTDRTLRDGNDPLYEYRLHFADEFNGSAPQSYILTFEPRPEVMLEVAAFGGVPASDEVLTKPLDEITVTFTKPVDASTFTVDDITLYVQGTKIENPAVGISTSDDTTFTLDLRNLSAGNGYYNLTVNTADIVDMEGYRGRNGSTASWVMYADGLLSVTLDVAPAESGKAEIVAGERVIGKTIKVKATPAEGYAFKVWTDENGDALSNSAEYSFTLLGDTRITAHFEKKAVTLTVADNLEGGSITQADGRYAHGDEITLTATPDGDYAFGYWIVNGATVGNGEPEITLLLTEDTAVSALFIREIYSHKLYLHTGWNWISSYISEDMPVSITGNAVKGMMGAEDKVDVFKSGNSYKVKLDYPLDIVHKGHLHATGSKSVALSAGWNWIANLHNAAADIDASLAGMKEGDVLAGQFGFAQYADGNWEGTLTELAPGHGYLYHTSTPGSLTFRDANEIVAPEAAANADVDPYRYPRTMNMVVEPVAVDENGDQKPVTEPIRIIAMCNGEIRGISSLIGGHQYLTVYGEAGDAIEFQVLDSDRYQTALDQPVEFEEGIEGTRSKPYVLPLNEDYLGIDGIAADSLKVTVINMQGILLYKDQPAEVINDLEPGFYIINGRTFCIR